MKKIISLIIVIIIVVSMMTSCTNTPDETYDESDVTTEATRSMHEETTEPIVYNTFDLSSFSIVFVDSVGLEYANTLKALIKEKAKVELSSVRASSSKKYEILIGDTGRDISKEYYAAPFGEVSAKFGVLVDGSKVFIAGKDKYTINKSINYFVDTYIKKDSQLVIEEKITELIDLDPSDLGIPLKAEGNGLRFVCNNILKQAVRAHESAARGDGLRVACLLLDADVISMQEVDELWKNKYGIESLMNEIGYKMVPLGFPDLCTPIFYKEATVKLIKSGYDRYDATDAINEVKTYQWALLEQIATGKQFIAVSTHFIAGSYNVQRSQCANQLSNAVKKLSNENGGVPAIVSGDFNSSQTSSVYTIMKSSLFSARDNCQTKVNMDYSTFNNFGQPPEKGDAIDHVFYSKKHVTAKHYETVVSPYTYSYADHVPVCFDFELS